MTEDQYAIDLENLVAEFLSGELTYRQFINSLRFNFGFTEHEAEEHESQLTARPLTSSIKEG